MAFEAFHYCLWLFSILQIPSRMLLSFLPNLNKYLKLWTRNGDSIPTQEFIKVAEKTPFPRLPQLEVPNMANFKIRSKLVLNNFFAAYAPQVKKLATNDHVLKLMQADHLNRLKFPNLRELHLSMTCREDGYYPPVADLHKIDADFWKLNLVVEVDPYFELEACNTFLSELKRLNVQVLEIFSPNRDSGRLRISETTTTESDLLVPNLKSLIIYQDAVSISVGIFKYYPQLQSVHHRLSKTFGDRSRSYNCKKICSKTDARGSRR